MTTIAYRDGVLAADTAMSRGATLIRGIEKTARRPRDGALAAIVGAGYYAGPFFAWFHAGCEGDPPRVDQDPDGCVTGIVVEPNGVATIYEMGGWYELRAPYWAIGSGRDQALGAMFAGADAETAVRAAIEHDHGTHGDVRVLRAKA